MLIAVFKGLVAYAPFAAKCRTAGNSLARCKQQGAAECQPLEEGLLLWHTGTCCFQSRPGGAAGMTERRLARRYDLSLPVNVRLPITARAWNARRPDSRYFHARRLLHDAERISPPELKSISRSRCRPKLREERKYSSAPMDASSAWISRRRRPRNDRSSGSDRTLRHHSGRSFSECRLFFTAAKAMASASLSFALCGGSSQDHKAGLRTLACGRRFTLILLANSIAFHSSAGPSICVNLALGGSDEKSRT